ncbi:MAG TPA: zinc ribbon domain-containing protein [Chloroflexota bacterium]|jgi:putative FmdB family regulatory protein|nr:zinc ribbon domain-containing protein [Chloroflexota bacterium]
MPVYEYYCSACHTKFDALRSMAALNEPQTCTVCGASEHVNRTLTVFARMGGGSGVDDDFGDSRVASSFGGGCGCGGACSCG